MSSASRTAHQPAAICWSLPLFAGHVLSHPAQGLRRDPEVRGYHILWKTLQELWVSLDEIFISLFCGHADGCVNSFLCGNRQLLIHGFDGKVESPDLISQLMGMHGSYNQQVRILQHLYVKAGGRKQVETLMVGKPPVLQPKPDNMLMSFFVYGEHPGGAMDNKSDLFTNIPFLEKVLLSAQPFMVELRFNDRLLLFGQRQTGPGLNILK
jgi:hypothetical protein